MERVGRANVAEHGTNYSMVSIPSLQGKTRIIAARAKCRKPGGGYVWICFYHTNLTLVKFSASEMQSWICHLNFTSAVHRKEERLLFHTFLQKIENIMLRANMRPFRGAHAGKQGDSFLFFKPCRLQKSVHKTLALEIVKKMNKSREVLGWGKMN